MTGTLLVCWFLSFIFPLSLPGSECCDLSSWLWALVLLSMILSPEDLRTAMQQRELNPLGNEELVLKASILLSKQGISLQAHDTDAEELALGCVLASRQSLWCWRWRLGLIQTSLESVERLAMYFNWFWIRPSSLGLACLCERQSLFFGDIASLRGAACQLEHLFVRRRVSCSQVRAWDSCKGYLALGLVLQGLELVGF